MDFDPEQWLSCAVVKRESVKSAVRVERVVAGDAGERDGVVGIDDNVVAAVAAAAVLLVADVVVVVVEVAAAVALERRDCLYGQIQVEGSGN